MALPPLHRYKPCSALQVFSRRPIYHEYQDQFRCGMHALNCFLGGRKIDDLIVANVAQLLANKKRDSHPGHRHVYFFDEVEKIELEVLMFCAKCVGVKLAHFRPPPLEDPGLTEDSKAKFLKILDCKPTHCSQVWPLSVLHPPQR
jgi:hypothetical protein